MSFYTCKVNFDDGVSESGRARTEKVEFLVEALSVTEAETKLAAHLKDSQRDFESISVSKSRVSEVVK